MTGEEIYRVGKDYGFPAVESLGVRAGDGAGWHRASVTDEGRRALQAALAEREQKLTEAADRERAREAELNAIDTDAVKRHADELRREFEEYQRKRPERIEALLERCANALDALARRGR